MFFNVEQIIMAFGYSALFAIIFSETGLLLGFFLPGDTLLFTAGMLASRNALGLQETIAICFIAAALGDSFGYYLGRKYGRGIFERKNFLDEYLNKENLEKTEHLYKKYGGKIIFMARFIPVVRTLAPTMAGTAQMDYKIFLFYNLLGAAAWVVSVTILGYFIGNLIPYAMEVAEILIFLVVALSITPIIIKYIRRK